MLKISEANYSGVKDVDLRKSHLIPTSPSLEVGYDDDTIQLVYQHMAPSNVAAFIQRRGRAGRNPDHSPVIITLLWPYRARDLFYFYRPNYLYKPSFDDIPLNARNRHVQLTHAFLGIFDWLAFQTEATGWPTVPDKIRQILSTNYTRVGNGRSSAAQRWQLRKRNMISWGTAILDRMETQLRAYLQSQLPAPAPGVIDEALDLLREKFFNPIDHRVLPEDAKSYDPGNFLGSFLRIDFFLKGDGGESIVEVTYPAKPDMYLTDEEKSRGLSTPLERGIAELLPGNATFRLRVDKDAYWTPIPLDGDSTYLYPGEQAKASAKWDEEGQERSLNRHQNSLMGIPTFLSTMYPGLRYFTPRNLRVVRFRQHDKPPEWRYDVEKEVSVHYKDALEYPSKHALQRLDIQAQAFPASVIIPFQLDSIGIERRITPPKQLDQIFAAINAYLDRPIGYLQVFYEYTINIRLQPLNNRDQESHKKLRRRFYSPYSTPKAPEPRLAAYEVSTQGIEFIVRKEFCRMVVLQVLQNDELRMHFRQRYVAYRMGKDASTAEPESDMLPMTYAQVARLVVTFWLMHHVPDHSKEPDKWKLSLEDLREARSFAQGNDVAPGMWCGNQLPEALFAGFSDEPRNQERVERLLDRLNKYIEEGFTDSREFREYLESVALHSLASIVKNHCALLGGVSPDALVVYADLPVGLEHVSRPDSPRILVLDTVSGGSGAIGQAFENLTRKPQTPLEGEERNLWSLLQRDIGLCPVGDGELLLRRFFLSMDYDEAVQFINDVRKNEGGEVDSREKELLASAMLRDKIISKGLSIPDEATFETMARIVFAGDVYVANTVLDSERAEPRANGLTEEGAEGASLLLSPQEAIHPPQLVHELLRQEYELQQVLPYQPQPEVVVAKALGSIDRWPHIKKLQEAMERDLASNRAIRKKEERLRRRMIDQLLSLLPRRCDDGCPVCLVNGSDMENSQFSMYLNSRRMLWQVRNILLIESVPPSTELIGDMIASQAVRVPGTVPDLDIPNLAGVLQAMTLNEDGKGTTTTLVPAMFIDNAGQSRPLSLIAGEAIDSQGEVNIASYLELRREYSDWVCKYKAMSPFRDPLEKKEVSVITDFLVRIPYEENGTEVSEEVYIEFWPREEDNDSERSLKNRCYLAARKFVIDIEEDDLLGNAFIEKIEAAVEARIGRPESKTSFSLTSLPSLPIESETNNGTPVESLSSPGILDYQTNVGAGGSILREGWAQVYQIPALPSDTSPLITFKSEEYLSVSKVEAFTLCNRKGILQFVQGAECKPTQHVEERIQRIVCTFAQEICARMRFEPGADPPTTPPTFTVDDWFGLQLEALLSVGTEGSTWTAENAAKRVQECLNGLYEWAIPHLQKRGP